MSKDEKEIANTKSQLRDFYRKERKARFIADSWLHILSAAEFTNSNSKNFASYLSYDVEPSTIDINKKLIQSGANLFLPRVLKNNDIEWVQWSGDEKQLKKVGKILEPIGTAVEPKQLSKQMSGQVLDHMIHHLDPNGFHLDRCAVLEQ